MTKILILGGNGMLGGAILRYLSNFPQYEIACTIRSDYKYFDHNIKCYQNIDLQYKSNFEFLYDYNPNIVINCIGDISKSTAKCSTLEQVYTNSLLPHILNNLAKEINFYLIHFSTDCVFSGEEGNYKKDESKQPLDYYGQSKSLGEIDGKSSLTIRTSIVGPTFDGKINGLYAWFKAQTGSISGYKLAIFSGMTTREVGKLVKSVIDMSHRPVGVWNVTGPVIDKYTLLTLFNERTGSKVEIVPDYTVKVNRSLSDVDFRYQFNIGSKVEWVQMVQEIENFNV